MEMRGLEKVEKAKEVMIDGGQHLIPIAVLFYLLLITRITVTYAGLITVLFAIAITQIRKKSRISIKRIIAIFDLGTRRSADLTALIAVIGIVQSAFTITGLGPRLSELLVMVAIDSPFLPDVRVSVNSRVLVAVPTFHLSFSSEIP